MDFKRLERMCEVYPDLEDALDSLIGKDEFSSWVRPDDWIDMDDLEKVIREMFYEEGSEEARMVDELEEIIGYRFIDEKLLVQALTRRNASPERNNETLEFLGDRALEYVVTQNMDRIFGSHNKDDVQTGNGGYYRSELSEGELTKVKANFVSKDHLAICAEKLGIDRYIVFGKSDKKNGMQRDMGVKEDAVEAIIGAIAVDSDWDYDVLEDVVDRLLDLQNIKAENAQPDIYDKLRSWAQKHPEVELHVSVVMKQRGLYEARIAAVSREYNISHEGIGRTRNEARIVAARMVYMKLQYGGYLSNLADSGIIPDLKNSINQVQELFQKGYIDAAEYSFEKIDKVWYCRVVSGTMPASGEGRTKTEAKKQAAFKLLKGLFER